MRIILFGLWSCLVTAGGLYFGTQLNAQSAVQPKGSSAPTDMMTTYSQPQLVMAPIVFDKRVAGYLFFNLMLEMDQTAQRKLVTPIDMILQDSYNTYVIGNPQLLFPSVPSLDFATFKTGMREQINRVAGVELVRSVYVGDVNFLTPHEVRNKQRLRSVWIQQPAEAAAPAPSSDH